MFDNINDSKSHFFIWLSVTLAIFAVGLGGMFYLIRSSDENVLEWEKIVFGVLLPYVVSTVPIGWCFRRQLLKGYIHVPTEKIKVFETNVVLAVGRILLCEILALVDVAIFAFYIVLAVISGPFFFIYFVVSSIVMMAKKKI